MMSLTEESDNYSLSSQFSILSYIFGFFKEILCH